MFRLVVHEDDYSWLEHVKTDVPLRLSEAVFLPELDCVFSEKQLRLAISKGLLPAERHGNTVYVTKAGVREWRERCRVPVNPHVCGSSRPAGENPVSPRGLQFGSSFTGETSVPRDAALMTLKALRERLQRT